MAKETEEIERIHVLVYKRDADWYRARFESTIGVSKAVRDILRNYRSRVEEKRREREHA